MIRKNGFTLIEVMIALCILAILSVMTMEGFRSITNNRTHIDAKLTQLSQLQMASVILRRDLSQIIDRGSSNASFQGSSSSLSFTRAGYVNPMGALHRSTLQSIQYNAGAGLSRATSSVLDPTSQTATSTRVILAGAANLKFQFIDPKGQLHDSWPPPKPKSDTSDDSSNNSSDNSTPPKPKWPKFPSGIQVSMDIKNWGAVTFIVPVYAGDLKKIEDLAQQANSQSTTTPS